MATVRYRVFEMPVADSRRQGQVIPIKAAMRAEQITTHVVDSILEKDEVNLADARIIVSGGRGVGGPAGFETIRKLAEVLGGAVGSSRSAVDAGWISYAHQVGQTGRTVRPDLYIACGISGANTASGGHEDIQGHCCHKSRSRSAYFQYCQLWNCG